MAQSSTDAASFYDAKPWRNEYGAGVDPEFRPLPDHNMGEFLSRASRQWGDNTAFTICLDSGLSASLTFNEAQSKADAFAAYLRFELGLEDGDRVALQTPNCLSYPVVAFGVLSAGTTLVNVNPLYTAAEMNHQLKDSGAKVLVIIDMFADKLPEALKGTQVEKVVLIRINEFFPLPTRLLVTAVLKYVRKQVPRVEVDATPLREALDQGRRHLSRLGQIRRPEPEDTAVLQYTGGTTGVAKGAQLTHGNLLANMAQIDAVAGPIIVEGQDTVLTALPLYHIFAFTFNLMTFYHAGCRNVLCPSPRPPSNLRKAFEQNRVTKFSGVNALFSGLVHEQWFRDNPPTSIDLSIAGGTALHSHVAENWQQVVGSPICEGYGLSETAPVVAVNPPAGEVRLGTIGVPVPGTEIRILDEAGNVMPQGEPGELAVRGPQVMVGYWNRPDETAQVMQDGWFRTGDVAVMDERGYLKIVDRKKDMIDVSGFNVYPNEVEDCLDGAPGIAEVAVVGIPQPKGGETVRAYVVKEDPSLTADDVIAYARQYLTSYKVPKEILFRDELPKSPVGKILRKNLREEATAETSATERKTGT